MRIGVIGAGAVGGTIAALLDRGGHEVAVTARGEQLAAIRHSGLVLGGAWGDHTARVDASETLQSAPELTFVCTKAQDAGGAIEANRQFLERGTVVIVQNGLGGVERARALLPRSDCIGALALYAASYLSPGHITVTTGGPTYLGVTRSPHFTEAAEVLGAVMPVVKTTNFAGCQWTKLIVNQVNAMPAITGLSVQQTIGHRRLRHIITASMREAVRVGLSSGVHFGSIVGLSHAALKTFAHAPLSAGSMLPLLMSARIGATPNPGSTLQSIRRGRLTEIDHLNGAVVSAAQRAGLQAPVNAALTTLVHEVEETGRFLAAADVPGRVTQLVGTLRH